MEGQGHHQLQHHHPHLLHQVGGGVDAGAGDRFPQWSIQETKEFLMIRAELDRTFMETKRNKLLWEVISNKMKEKGFNRSAEQCKCKWKNLFTRYKGCETMEPEAIRQQFPFYNEIHSIFAARMWSEMEGGAASGSKKKAVQLSSDEEEENEESEGDKVVVRKKKRGKLGGGGNNSVKEILEEFMKQQMKMEMEWRETYEARENERRMKEMEWRQTMEALENERMMMERRWREREEQRRMREEVRAEKRDALITALLNKFTRDHHHNQGHHM